MSGGDVYEVRMRVKSGPKSGAIGNSSSFTMMNKMESRMNEDQISIK